MGKETGIQWTDATFNPWVGCQRVSPGCTNCYAETYDRRVGGAMVDGSKALRWGATAPRVRTKTWNLPLKLNGEAAKRGRRMRLFCSSLADVFEMPDPRVAALNAANLTRWRLELFDLIRATPLVDWQLLTKRPENVIDALLAAHDEYGRQPVSQGLEDWIERWISGEAPRNVWLGTTIEDQQRCDDRLPELLKVAARVHFVSAEPLLEAVRLPEQRFARSRNHTLDWIIIGGESGPGARVFHLDWARDLVRQSRAVGAAPFVKQLGRRPLANHPMEPGAHLEVRLTDSSGGDTAEWPDDLRVREFPEAPEFAP